MGSGGDKTVKTACDLLCTFLEETHSKIQDFNDLKEKGKAQYDKLTEIYDKAKGVMDKAQDAFEKANDDVDFQDSIAKGKAAVTEYEKALGIVDLQSIYEKHCNLNSKHDKDYSIRKNGLTGATEQEIWYQIKVDISSWLCNGKGFNWELFLKNLFQVVESVYGYKRLHLFIMQVQDILGKSNGRWPSLVEDCTNVARKLDMKETVIEKYKNHLLDRKQRFHCIAAWFVHFGIVWFVVWYNIWGKEVAESAAPGENQLSPLIEYIPLIVASIGGIIGLTKELFKNFIKPVLFSSKLHKLSKQSKKYIGSKNDTMMMEVRDKLTNLYLFLQVEPIAKVSNHKTGVTGKIMGRLAIFAHDLDQAEPHAVRVILQALSMISKIAPMTCVFILDPITIMNSIEDKTDKELISCAYISKTFDLPIFVKETIFKQTSSNKNRKNETTKISLDKIHPVLDLAKKYGYISKKTCGAGENEQFNKLVEKLFASKWKNQKLTRRLNCYENLLGNVVDFAWMHESEMKKHQMAILLLAVEKWPLLMSWVFTLIDTHKKLYAEFKDSTASISPPPLQYIKLDEKQFANFDVYELLTMHAIPLSQILPVDVAFHFEHLNQDSTELAILLALPKRIKVSQLRNPKSSKSTSNLLRRFLFNEHPGLYEYSRKVFEKLTEVPRRKMRKIGHGAGGLEIYDSEEEEIEQQKFETSEGDIQIPPSNDNELSSKLIDDFSSHIKEIKKSSESHLESVFTKQNLMFKKALKKQQKEYINALKTQRKKFESVLKELMEQKLTQNHTNVINVHLDKEKKKEEKEKKNTFETLKEEEEEEEEEEKNMFEILDQQPKTEPGIRRVKRKKNKIEDERKTLQKPRDSSFTPGDPIDSPSFSCILDQDCITR